MEKLQPAAEAAKKWRSLSDGVKKHKIAVLISGGGTNLQSIIDACVSGMIPCEVSLVISNREDAYGLVRAKHHGIPTAFIDHGAYTSREEFERELIRRINSAGADLVCLAGFMRVLTPLFISAFKNKIMNIHPALLPSFPGTRGNRQANDYGVKFSGVTVHFVDEGTDTGPIIIQAVVPVYDEDTEETLAERTGAQEKRVYPLAIKYFFQGRLKIRGRKVILKDGRNIPPFAHINPLEE